MLPDGRVGFIDFGLVGKIPASTWPALMAALAAFASEDTEKLARALLTLQATDADVNIQVLPRLLFVMLFRSIWPSPASHVSDRLHIITTGLFSRPATALRGRLGSGP